MLAEVGFYNGKQDCLGDKTNFGHVEFPTIETSCKQYFSMGISQCLIKSLWSYLHVDLFKGLLRLSQLTDDWVGCPVVGFPRLFQLLLAAVDCVSAPIESPNGSFHDCFVYHDWQALS